MTFHNARTFLRVRFRKSLVGEMYVLVLTQYSTRQRCIFASLCVQTLELRAPCDSLTNFLINFCTLECYESWQHFKLQFNVQCFRLIRKLHSHNLITFYFILHLIVFYFCLIIPFNVFVNFTFTSLFDLFF